MESSTGKHGTSRFHKGKDTESIMLKVTLHFSTPNMISQANTIGRLDIGYARLDARADYKALMFTAGLGEHPPIQIYDYPRWSCSVWDLVARAICKSLNGREVLKPMNIESGNCAFIDNLTARIEHWPDGFDVKKAIIGTAHVSMGRRRGSYTANFKTDVEGDEQETSVFTYKTSKLKPWDLMARAYAWSVNEGMDLPPKPELYVPIPIQDCGESLVNLNTVSEPAYSGIMKWMSKCDIKTIVSEFVSGPCVTEANFVSFLKTAV
jgi:hypothetical protein